MYIIIHQQGLFVEIMVNVHKGNRNSMKPLTKLWEMWKDMHATLIKEQSKVCFKLCLKISVHILLFICIGNVEIYVLFMVVNQWVCAKSLR